VLETLKSLVYAFNLSTEDYEYEDEDADYPKPKKKNKPKRKTGLRQSNALTAQEWLDDLEYRYTHPLASKKYEGLDVPDALRTELLPIDYQRFWRIKCKVRYLTYRRI
jgi:hypothetical protein